jgi:hypothetical protein
LFPGLNAKEIVRLWGIRRHFAVPLAIGLTLCSVMYARGGRLVVTTTNDTGEVTSLRGAIILANKRGGYNWILLKPGTYRLTDLANDPLGQRSEDLKITRGRLLVMGTGPGVVIDASGQHDRVFEVFPWCALTLSRLTITGGSGRSRGLSLTNMNLNRTDGGAIYNAGTLSLIDCLVTRNSTVPTGVLGSGGAGGNGGAIYNTGVLTVKNSTISQNSSLAIGEGVAGGAICNIGVLTLNNCVVSNNSCEPGGGGDGGGIYNSGICTANNSLVSENAAGNEAWTYGGRGGNGGGFYNAGAMILNNCTVAQNTSGNGTFGSTGGPGGSGAGIYNVGRLKMNCCTITGNPAGHGGQGGFHGESGGIGGSGGGIYNSGVLGLLSCTLAGNTGGTGGAGGLEFSFFSSAGGQGGTGGSGGGIYNAATNLSNVNVRNTLVALNSVGSGGTNGGTFNEVSVQTPGSGTSPAGIGPDVFGLVRSGNFNLIGVVDGSVGFTNGLNADLAGTMDAPLDPLLGPLQMNGGPTPTRALLPGSPAIDQGRDFGLQTDQRGHHRRQNFPSIPNAVGGDGSDIGAFEVDVTARRQ